MAQYAYEYGKRWNVKTPRNAIAFKVDRLHVSTPLPEVITLIEQAIPANDKGYTAAIRKQCVVYAMLRHTANFDLYNRVMKGY